MSVALHVNDPVVYIGARYDGEVLERRWRRGSR